MKRPTVFTIVCYIGASILALFLYHQYRLSNRPISFILITGQSLSIGWSGKPPLTVNQPYKNLMQSWDWSLAPLVEGTSSTETDFGPVETPASAMANTLTALSPWHTYQSIITISGQGGFPYVDLKKGTSVYTWGLNAMRKAKRDVEEIGRPFRIAAIVAIHGENDEVARNGNVYSGFLKEWQNDYERDVKEIIGQTNSVPLFTDQMSSHTGFRVTTPTIALAQLDAAEQNSGKIYLVGPKYFLNYNDYAHLTNESYQWLGEYYGKVMKKVLVDGEQWRPLLPELATRTGNVITVRFHVPVPPLVLDTKRVFEQTNYGFEYDDGGEEPPTIVNVFVKESDMVGITLSFVPKEGNERLRYAYTGVYEAIPGAHSTGSARGNLRDSDMTPSLYGHELFNWAVHFDTFVTSSVSSD